MGQDESLKHVCPRHVVRCRACGRAMTEEEIHFLEHTCCRCERVAFDEAERRERDDGRD